jgi:hypothetical protein
VFVTRRAIELSQQNAAYEDMADKIESVDVHYYTNRDMDSFMSKLQSWLSDLEALGVDTSHPGFEIWLEEFGRSTRTPGTGHPFLLHSSNFPPDPEMYQARWMSETVLRLLEIPRFSKFMWFNHTDHCVAPGPGCDSPECSWPWDQDTVSPECNWWGRLGLFDYCGMSCDIDDCRPNTCQPKPAGRVAEAMWPLIGPAERLHPAQGSMQPGWPADTRVSIFERDRQLIVALLRSDWQEMELPPLAVDVTLEDPPDYGYSQVRVIDTHEVAVGNRAPDEPIDYTDRDGDLLTLDRIVVGGLPVLAVYDDPAPPVITVEAPEPDTTVAADQVVRVRIQDEREGIDLERTWVAVVDGSQQELFRAEGSEGGPTFDCSGGGGPVDLESPTGCTVSTAGTRWPAGGTLCVVAEAWDLHRDEQLRSELAAGTHCFQVAEAGADAGPTPDGGPDPDGSGRGGCSCRSGGGGDAPGGGRGGRGRLGGLGTNGLALPLAVAILLLMMITLLRQRRRSGRMLCYLRLRVLGRLKSQRGIR